MSPEERELLEKSVLLAEENNKILRSLRRSMIWGRVMSFIYWLFIICSAVGVYYFVEPYFTKVMEVYDSVMSAQQKLNKTAGSVDNLLKVPDSILNTFKLKN